MRTLLLTALLTTAGLDPATDARLAMRAGEFAAARKHAEEAVKTAPSAELYALLGAACDRLKDQPASAAAYAKACELVPDNPDLRDRLGDAQLKAGRFADAVAAFDAVLKARPDFAPEHWRRGIALYYLGRFADGVKQFEAHRAANPEDVENAVWHYLCNVKVAGKGKARAVYIPVTRDRRVPMAEVHRMFAGQLNPQEVLAAADRTPAGTPAGTAARFYAHLYVGLWYESEGEAAKVLEHLTPAVEKYRVEHYMWDVAKVHLELARKRPK
jgi:lipoprotein NlpI